MRFTTILCAIWPIVSSLQTSCRNASVLCRGETNCNDCIRVHHCCSFCYQDNFAESRCDIEENLSGCGERFFIRNERTSVSSERDGDFADMAKGGLQAVQLRPQEIRIKLRKDEPVNITVKYQPAKNFPLDLYYLMDLTFSMRKDLSAMTLLGVNLTHTLSDLTANYRIAFGSYVDKMALPFYLMDEESSKNPCQVMQEGVCEVGYLFKHKLNFTANIDNFITEVKNSNVSANVDNLEGGMDALMQILLCDRQLDWSQNSRKIILLATESEMHLAGDGLLSGSTQRNPGLCLMDPQGNYLNPILYDYPSLEEIHRQLKKRKINVIIATKENSLDYYKKLNELIPEATFVDKLEADSTNVLNLVREGYYAFIRRATLSVNTSHADGLEVQFFADCQGNGYFVKADTCDNAKEGRATTFKVQFLLTKYQDRATDSFFVEERNIAEKVAINIDYIGSRCNCGSDTTRANCLHGVYECGNCTCLDGWAGELCDHPCDSKLDSCRYTVGDWTSASCSKNGDCICGKCRCEFPFEGAYCNYSCPFEQQTRRICGGNGYCLEGACRCNEGFAGDDCLCDLAEDNCRIAGASSLCNGHGECQCNSCKCHEGFHGGFCESCNECEGLCNIFTECVVNKLLDVKTGCHVGNASVHMNVVEDLGKDEHQVCFYRYKGKDGEDCETFYKYAIKGDRSVEVRVQEPVCSSITGALVPGLIAGLLVVLVPLLALLAWKCLTMYRDKREYQRFETEHSKMSNVRGENPLYLSPVVTYNNPMESATIHSKRD